MSLESWAYIPIVIPICRRLFRHWVSLDFCLARIRLGNIMLAKIPIIAMTTSSSIKVNPKPALWAASPSRFLFIYPAFLV